MKNKIIIATAQVNVEEARRLNIEVMEIIRVPKRTSVKMLLELLNGAAYGIYFYKYSVVDRMPKKRRMT